MNPHSSSVNHGGDDVTSGTDSLVFINDGNDDGGSSRRMVSEGKTHLIGGRLNLRPGNEPDETRCSSIKALIRSGCGHVRH